MLSLVNIESLHKMQGITAKDIAKWRSGEVVMNLEDVGRVTVQLLKQRKIYISKNNHHEVQTKAIRIKQLNLKLSEDADGANAALHDIIDEYSDVIHDFLK